MVKKHNTPNLTSGSVVNSLITISLPIIFANILQTVYQFIDTFWVGRLGAEAVAAVSLSFPILFFLNSMAMGFALAGSILVAQYNGKKDVRNVSLATGQTLTMVSLVSIVIAIFGYLSSRFLLSYLTTDAMVLSQATSYLQISFLAMPASFLYIIFQSSLRGVGEVKFPMVIVLITVIINFIIDPLFMNGWLFIPPMGVAGVALATLVTEYLAAFIGTTILFTDLFGFKVHLNDLVLKFDWIKKIFALGLPSSFEMSSRSLSMVLMTFLVSTFGTYTVAAYGIGSKILSFVIIPAIGLSISTSALVGNNLGAKQFERTEKIVKAGLMIGFTCLTVIGIFIFVFAKVLSAFFVPGDLELIKTSALFIKIMSLTFGFVGIQMVVSGAVKGAGQTSTAMLLAMSNAFILFVLSYIFSVIFKLGQLGIWISYPISYFIGAIIALVIYWKRDWLRKKLI